MRRARVWIPLAGTVLAAGLALGLRLQPAGDPEPESGRAGTDEAAGTQAGTSAPEAADAPYPCARLDDGAAAAAAGEADIPEMAGQRRLRLEGDTLRVAPAPRDRELVLGMVADARGAAAAMPAVRRAFAEAGVELVVSLGGMGRARDELHAVLEPLVVDAPWLLLVMPGDWEAVDEHRAAVRALARYAGPAGGLLDGSQVRFVEMDGAVLATLPGAPHASRLVAGARGCVRSAADAAQVVAALAARPGVRVLLSHAPPRQRGPGASDVGATGIHVGEQALAAALAATPVDVVVHGLVAPASRAPQGARPLAKLPAGASPGPGAPARRPLILAAGAVDPMAGPLAGGSPPQALVVSIGPKQVAWRALPLVL